MASIDLSFLDPILPLVLFFLIFTIVYAVLAKTKILGDSKFVQLFIAFLVSTLFITFAGVRTYILTVTPWFAVFLVLFIFIAAMIGFSGNIPKGLSSGIGIAFVVAMLLLFLVSAYFVFSAVGPIVKLADWFSSPKVYSSLLLLALGALISWLLVKFGK